jgi:hypothetical protein
MRRFAKSVTGKPVRGFESPSLRRLGRAARFAPVALASFLATSCVERTLLIRTEPPGAMVILDAKRIEKPTPVEIPFTYGGLHEIILVRNHEKAPDGTTLAWRPKILTFDTESIAFDGPVLDILVALTPVTFHDRHEVDATLEPATLWRLFDVDQAAYLDSLRERAEILRVRTRETQLGARPRDDDPSLGSSSRASGP